MTDTPATPVAGLRGRHHRRPESERYPLLWAHEYLRAFPTPTFPIDRTEGLTQLGMQGNDEWGDCVEAGEVHGEMVGAAASGGSFTPDPNLAVERAQQYAGFGSTPPGPGTDMPAYYQALYQAKIILAWAPVDLSNLPACYALMSLGFGIQIGVELYDANMAQFDSGQPFDAVGSPDPSEGHAVLWAYSESPTGPHKVGTWSIWEGATHAWLEGACLTNPDGEGYLVVYTEEQAAAFTPALFADVQALGGQGPVVTPPPPPTPGAWRSVVEDDVTAMQLSRVDLDNANSVVAASALTAAEKAEVHTSLARAAGVLQTQEGSDQALLNANPT